METADLPAGTDLIVEGEAGDALFVIIDGEAAIRDKTLMSSDIVVLDVMLPKKSGLDVLRAARNDGVRTPVIVLTSREDVQRWARVLGVSQFIANPPTFSALQKAVLDALSQPEARGHGAR